MAEESRNAETDTRKEHFGKLTGKQKERKRQNRTGSQNNKLHNIHDSLPLKPRMWRNSHGAFSSDWNLPAILLVLGTPLRMPSALTLPPPIAY
jgi:hypothetical protein